jgi:exodeoxyribonuclease V beta subunit
MRLYLAWPQTRDSGKTALMYLRRPPSDEKGREAFLTNGGPSPELAVLDDSDAELWEELPEVVRELPSLQRTRLAADISGAAVLKAREFMRELPAGSGWLSFSSLTAGTHGEGLSGAAIAGSRVEKVKPLAEVTEPLFAAFPGGTATGNAIHKIFEELDFSRAVRAGWQNDSEVVELVHNTLAHFNLVAPGTGAGDQTASKLTAAVLKMLDQVLNVPLPGRGTTIKLSRPDISLRQEMEFCLPVAGEMNAERISAILRPQETAAFNRLDPEELSRWQLNFPAHLPDTGYLNGFIDLIFCVDERYYLLDWKTNNLGPDYSDYSPEALQRNMLDSDYLLQYNLYLVALNRFLENRLKDYDYEANFGGVYYLYVRGINGLDDSSGIFYDRPGYETVKNLTETICGRL